MEMPRACSISIQSETTPWRFALPSTAPADEIALACSASASVSVDFPASGWLITAKVRRREASRITSDVATPRVLSAVMVPQTYFFLLSRPQAHAPCPRYRAVLNAEMVTSGG